VAAIIGKAMNEKTDLVFVEKARPVDYHGFSKLPLERIDIFRDLVQLRMVYYEDAFHPPLEIFNRIIYERYYEASSYEQRRKMLDLWNLPSLNSDLALRFLRKKEYNCKVIINLDSEFDLLCDYAKEMTYPIIALSTTFSPNWAFIGKQIRRIREEIQNAIFILGGAFVAEEVNTKGVESLEKPMRKYGISYVLFAYNSELDLLNTVKGIHNNNIVNVNNIAFFNNSKMFCTGETKWNPPQLSLPLCSLNRINESPTKTETIQLRISSGCPFKCSFCTYPILSKGYHKAPIETLKSQLDMLKQMNINSIVFVDDTPNVPMNRFIKILEILRDYNFRWYSFLRVQYMNDELVRLMKESGCDGVYIGIESANDSVLKNMNKKARNIDYEKGIAILKKYRITVFAAFIIGFPGETPQSIQDTVEFIKKNAIDYYSLKEFWYSHQSSIHQNREKYSLVGIGNEWKHSTMTSEEASIQKRKIFEDIHNSVYIDSDTSLWYLLYLRDRGFDWNSIEESNKIINKMMKQDNAGDFAKKESLIDELERCLVKIELKNAEKKVG
jgi:p-methyltransferase